MATIPRECPACFGQNDIRYRPRRRDWFCDACDHRWTQELSSSDAVSAESVLAAQPPAEFPPSPIPIHQPADSAVVAPGEPVHNYEQFAWKQNDAQLQPLIGRDWLFEEVHRRFTSQSASTCVLFGPAGVGKSAFLTEWARRQPPGRVLLHYRCRRYDPHTLSPWTFLRDLSRAIREEYPQLAAGERMDETSRPLWQGDPIAVLEEHIAGPLNTFKAPPAEPRFLLLDGLEAAVASRHRISLIDLLESGAALWPSWLRVFMTSADEPGLRDRLPGRVNLLLDADDPRQTGDVEAYLRSRCEKVQLAQPLPTGPHDYEIAVATMIASADGSFAFASLFAEAVARGEFQRNDVQAIPRTVDDYFTRWFERRFPSEDEHNAICRVLQVLAASPGPLSQDQLAAVMGESDTEWLSDLLHELAPRLKVATQVEYASGGDRKLYALGDVRLIEWLTSQRRRGEPFTIDPAAGRLRLVKHAWREYEHNRETISLYCASRLPTLLQEAQEWERLCAVLTNLRFVQAKIAGGMTDELIADYQQALAAIPVDEAASLRELRSFSRFVIDCKDELQLARGGTHFVARNYCSRGPVVEAAEAMLADTPELWISRDPRPPAVGDSSVCPTVFDAHTHEVHAVAVTQKFDLAVSAGTDRTLRIWRPRTGETLHVLRGHTDDVNAVAMTPDGRLAVTAGLDRTLRVWRLETGACIRVIHGYQEGVTAVAVTPDGQTAVTCGDWDESLRLWDLRRGKQLNELTGHMGSVTCVAVSACGRLAVSSSFDKTVRVWDLARGVLKSTFKGHTDGVIGVALTPDAHRAVSVGFDQTVRVWDIDAEESLETLSGHRGNVTCVDVTPDGLLAVSGSSDQTLRVWDLAAGRCIKTLRGHTGWVGGVCVSPDGKHVLSAGGDKTVRVWDLRAPDDPKPLSQHGGPVRGLIMSPKGGELAVTASHDARLCVWDTKRGAVLHVLKGHTGFVTAVCLAEKGQTAVSAGSDATIRLWDVSEGRLIRTIPTGTDGLSAIALIDNGPQVVCGGADCRLSVRHLTSGAEIAGSSKLNSAVNGVCCRPGETVAVAALADGTLLGWDWQSSRVVWTADAHRGEAIAVALLSKDAIVYSTGEDGVIKAWDVENGYPLGAWSGHAGPVYAIAFSEDEQLIVTAGEDQCLRLRDRQTGCELAAYVASAPIYSLAGPQNARFGCGCADGSVHFLSIQNHDSLVTVGMP